MLKSWTGWINNQRLVAFFGLVHELGVTEVADQVRVALNAGVLYTTNFWWIKKRPASVVESEIEIFDGGWVVEVYERVADVAPILGVHGQVKEVVLSLEMLIDLFEHHRFGVLVGDVPDHQRRFFVLLNPADVYMKLVSLFTLTSLVYYPFNWDVIVLNF